jgi:hypothetical protein
MWASENNWYSWKYGDGPQFGRQTSDLPFATQYGNDPFTGTIGTFKEELIRAAQSTVDHYPGMRPSVFFSGGVDSELILRAYVEAGTNPEVFIIRFENDYNIYDVSYAVVVCNLLNVPYKIVDFNLEKFYNNDAELISEQAQIDRVRMLPHLKFTECTDGLIIVGHSDVRWYRPEEDYSVPCTWLAQDFEHDIGCDKYNMMHNRPAVFQWWKWSPGLILSYTRLDWFKKLVNDGYKGKLGLNSTKIIGFREAYPDMISREKQTGFEGANDGIVKEFQAFIEKKYNGFPYRQYVERTLDEMTKEIYK